MVLIDVTLPKVDVRKNSGVERRQGINSKAHAMAIRAHNPLNNKVNSPLKRSI
jgi:hypothetical protein